MIMQLLLVLSVFFPGFPPSLGIWKLMAKALGLPGGRGTQGGLVRVPWGRGGSSPGVTLPLHSRADHVQSLRTPEGRGSPQNKHTGCTSSDSEDPAVPTSLSPQNFPVAMTTDLTKVKLAEASQLTLF